MIETKDTRKKVLEVENLSVQYKLSNGLYFNALRNISFDVKRGEVVGLVGESGSGKSTTAKAILALADHATGFVKINGELVPNRTKDKKGRVSKWLASKVQMIFQDAKSSLNPREKVFDVIVEGAQNQKLAEKSIKYNKIAVAEKFIKNNNDKKDNLGYRLLELKINYDKAITKVEEEYDNNYSKIFTKYDDEKVVLKGILLKKKSDINIFKTSYKIYKSSNFENKFDKSENSSVIKKYKLSMKNKLKDDLMKINKEFEINFESENIKFKKIKGKYLLEKGKLKVISKNKKNELSRAFKVAKKELDSKIKLDTKAQELLEKYEAYKKDNKGKLNKKEFYSDLVKQVMEKVSISPEHSNRYPGEFSGGQAQRIAIARTLIMESDLIIADEPISALDVSIQAQVINLLKKLIKDEKLTVMFIAHDLQVVRYISDRIIVMYKGELIEKGPANEIYNNPKHPYTKSLINAIPSIDNPKRIRQSKAYKSEYSENFINVGTIKKEWVNVAKDHYIFGTKEQIKRWTK